MILLFLADKWPMRFMDAITMGPITDSAVLPHRVKTQIVFTIGSEIRWKRTYNITKSSDIKWCKEQEN